MSKGRPQSRRRHRVQLQADQPEGPIIFSYTRADAIGDGVLVDLGAMAETASVVREAGFRLPIAMTAAAYESLIGTGELPPGQSVSGRLWDVLMVLRSMIRRLPDGADRVDFSVSVWDGDEPGRCGLLVSLRAGRRRRAGVDVDVKRGRLTVFRFLVRRPLKGHFRRQT